MGSANVGNHCHIGDESAWFVIQSYCMSDSHFLSSRNAEFPLPERGTCPETDMNATELTAFSADAETRLASAEPLDAAFWRALVARAQEGAGAGGLDGLLILDARNVTYLTGFFHIPNERPLGLWLPASGVPALLVAELERENAQAGWITDIRTYPEFPGEEDPLVWMLRETGARRIGIDTLEARKLPLLKAMVDHLEMTDRIEHQRMIKTGPELALTRAAAAAADLVLAAVLRDGPAILQAGGTEIDILDAGFSAARTVMARHLGSRFGTSKCAVLGTVHSGARAALPHGKTIRRQPRPGETMIVGIGAAVGGYHAESAATFVLGDMSADQRACLTAALRCRDAAVAALRPGANCAEIDRAASASLRGDGFGPAIRHRIGHGMGVHNHEAPWLAPGDPTPVAANMVLSNEPGIYRPGIDGYRLISTMIPREDGSVEIPSHFLDVRGIEGMVLPI